MISVWICNDINGSTCQECYYNEVDGESGRRKKIAKIILLSESPMSPGRLKMEWVGSFCFIIIFILLYRCIWCALPGAVYTLNSESTPILVNTILDPVVVKTQQIHFCSNSLLIKDSLHTKNAF